MVERSKKYPPSDAEYDMPMHTERRFHWSVSVSAALVFIGAVYGYAIYGGPYVNTLDDRVGEVLAQRAKALTRAPGYEDRALETYRAAISAQFDTSARRVWTAHDFAWLLLANGLYEETLQVARSVVDLPEENGVAYGQASRALFALNRFEEAIENGEAWSRWARARGQVSTEAYARYTMGRGYASLGDETKALDEFISSFEIQPRPDSALSAARILSRMGRAQEAEGYVAYVLEKGNRQQVELARTLLSPSDETSQ